MMVILPSVYSYFRVVFPKYNKLFCDGSGCSHPMLKGLYLKLSLLSVASFQQQTLIVHVVWGKI